MSFSLNVLFVESLNLSVLPLVSFLANLHCVSCLLGIERLLLLLGEKPSSPSPSEGAACERVQQKAAVTLARLSRDPDVAQIAIQLKGSAEFQLSHNDVVLSIPNSIVLLTNVEKNDRNKQSAEI